MIARTLAGVLVSMFLIAGCGGSAHEAKEKAALQAVESWLNLVDNRKYSESWVQSAGYLKAVVPQVQFRQALETARGSLGNVLSRKLKVKHYLTSVEGAPDGEYVLVQFDTSFENKKMGMETVTPMMDKDGVWRVSGYFIK